MIDKSINRNSCDVRYENYMPSDEAVTFLTSIDWELNLGPHARKQWVMPQDNCIVHGISKNLKLIESFAQHQDLLSIINQTEFGYVHTIMP